MTASEMNEFRQAISRIRQILLKLLVAKQHAMCVFSFPFRKLSFNNVFHFRLFSQTFRSIAEVSSEIGVLVFHRKSVSLPSKPQRELR